MPRATPMALLALTNALLGFAYSWIITTTLGAKSQTDALFAGMVVPQLLVAVVSGSLTQVMVPLLAVSDAKSGGDEAWNFLSLMGALFGVLALVLCATASVWVPWTVPGFPPATKLLTVSLARIQLLSMVWTALSGVVWSAYYARGKFVLTERSSLAANVIGLTFLWLALPRLGVAAAAWTLVLELALQTMFLLPGLGRPRRPDWNSPTMREAWRRMKPLLMGTAYFKTDQLVERCLASMTPAGDLSLLALATQIYGAGSQVFNKAMVVPIAPTLAQQAHRQDWPAFESTALRRNGLVLLLSAVCVGALALVGEPLLQALFGHGRIKPSDVHLLWILLLCLSGFWIGGNCGMMTSTLYYAQGNTRFPTQMSAWTYSVYLPLKVLAAARWGVVGIAVATSLYYVLNCAILTLTMNVSLKKKRLLA